MAAAVEAEVGQGCVFECLGFLEAANDDNKYQSREIDTASVAVQFRGTGLGLGGMYFRNDRHDRRDRDLSKNL